MDNEKIIADLKEIIKCDDLALYNKIKYYLDFHPHSVILAYAELVSRDKIFTDEIHKDFNDSIIAFTARNNAKSMNLLLYDLLYQLGYPTYSKLIYNEIDKTIPPRKTILPVKNLKYPTLLTISEVYTGFGYVLAVVSLIAGMILFDTSIWLSLSVIVSGALIVLGLFALSEAIKVFIDIEENTRLRNKE